MKYISHKRVTALMLVLGVVVTGFTTPSTAQAYTGTWNQKFPSASSDWRYGIAQSKNYIGETVNNYVWSDFNDTKRVHRSSVEVTAYNTVKRSPWKDPRVWAQTSTYADKNTNKAYYSWR